MSQLHPIDRPHGGYKLKELDKFMVFCILDTACTYKQVCKAFDYLEKYDMTTRKGLREAGRFKIRGVLRLAGYRWADQKAHYLHEFAHNDIDLKKVSREDLVKSIRGVGLKLASFFLRNTRGEDYAVLDVHTLRFIDNLDITPHPKTYKEKESLFRKIAKRRGMTTTELDLQIWQKNRVGNKNG